MRATLVTTLGLLLAAPAFGEATQWEIDPAHSNAEFSIKHMMVSTVRGNFSGMKSTATFDDKNPKNSKIEATIDTTTVNTHEPKRDAHLKSPDFFDAAKYPTMSFKSTKVTPAGKNKYTVVGDLTIKDQTHPVTLAVTTVGPTKDMMGSMRRGFEATTKIDRKQWGITWNHNIDSGGMVLGDDVNITLDGEYVEHSDSTEKAAAAPANAGAKTTPPPAAK